MGVKLNRINLENKFEIDMIINNGFVINNEEDAFAPVNVDQLINSPKFTDVEYRCDCGKLTGQDIVGGICPSCHSEIMLRSLNFGYTAWVDIAPHKVIVPVYYAMLKRVLTDNMLKYILGNYKSDFSVQYNENDKDFLENKKNKKTGRISADNIVAIEKKVPKSKYIYRGLGHDVFYQRFEEVLRACCKPSKELEILIEEKDAVFSSKIPIYSTAFRPVSKTSETMFYPKINKPFSQIVAVQCKLRDMKLEQETIQALNCIQTYWIEAVEHLIANDVAKKDGFVRSEIVGGTFNFSTRSVIVLDISLRCDEIDLPLNTLIPLFSFRITHILHVRYHYTLEQAYLYTLDYQEHMDIILPIMDELLAEGQWVQYLREPVNQIGSFVIAKIRNYKIDDDTMSIPNEVLPGLNADFDGDQLNGVLLGTRKEGIVQLFEQFHYSFMTNRVTEKTSVPLGQWCDCSLGIMTE